MPTTVLSEDDKSWWKLEKPEWKTVLKSTGKQFKADGVTTLSASVTLRIVLSLVPALIAGIAIAAQVISTSDIRELVTSAGSVVPGDAQDFVTDTVDQAIMSLQDQGLVALVISIGVGLFAASSAAVQLIKSLNVAYDKEEKRGFIGQRTASLAVIGALVLALIGMFVAIVLGPSLLELIVPASIINSPLNILITIGRFVAAVLILMVFFGFTFWFGPSRERPKLRFFTPGAVFGVIGWLLLSYLFSLYVRLAGNYSATYGAVAGIVVLLVWLNYSFTVLLMGAELDSELERYTAKRRAARAVASVKSGGAVPSGVTPASALPTGEPVDQAGVEGAEPPDPVAAAHGPDLDTDLDRVTDDMPRHPGLVGAAVHPATPSAVGSRPPTPPADGAGGAASAPAAPSPGVLMGAARKTSGAGLAAIIWGRLRD